jgi:hypothetical protein
MEKELRDMIYNTLLKVWETEGPPNVPQLAAQSILTAQADALIIDVHRICSNEDEYHQFISWLNNIRLESDFDKDEEA